MLDQWMEDGLDVGDPEETLDLDSVIAALSAELLPLPSGIDERDESHRHKVPRKL
jgi:hypothetical protein